MKINLDNRIAELCAMKAVQNKRGIPIGFEPFAEIFAGYPPQEQPQHIDVLDARNDAQQKRIGRQLAHIDGVVVAPQIGRYNHRTSAAPPSLTKSILAMRL